MFDIIFLGTSASAPSVYRGLSSTAVIAGEDRFLIDCGEGTQRQILKSGIGFKRLNHIFLTHSHLDHILGLGGLLSTFTRWEGMDDIHIYGGKYTLERVKILLDVVFSGRSYEHLITLHIVKDGEEIYRGKSFSVVAFTVPHRGPDCFGYQFIEDTHRPFLAEKAQELGIPAGPERAQLVRGKSITLGDGTVIEPEMVLGEAITGTRVIFTGDIANLDAIEAVASDVDVLVTEATFLREDVDIARSHGHITAYDAATFAKEHNVKHLLLTHVSRRYREYDVVSEARNIFSDTYVVRDLDYFSIRRGQPLQKIDYDTNM